MPVLYEVHNLRAAKGSNEVPTFRGYRTEVCAHCEDGYAMVESGHVFNHQGERIRTFSGGENIFENFIQAVRGQRREDLAADILAGHLSTTVRHLGNISHRVGAVAGLGQIRERVAGDGLTFFVWPICVGAWQARCSGNVRPCLLPGRRLPTGHRRSK